MTSPLKTEIRHLEERIKIGNDAIARANRWAYRNHCCCASCSVPGYNDLCTMVEERERRLEQLRSKIERDTSKRLSYKEKLELMCQEYVPFDRTVSMKLERDQKPEYKPEWACSAQVLVSPTCSEERLFTQRMTEVPEVYLTLHVCKDNTSIDQVKVSLKNSERSLFQVMGQRHNLVLWHRGWTVRQHETDDRVFILDTAVAMLCKTELRAQPWNHLP